MNFVKKTHLIFAIVILFGATDKLYSEPMTYYHILTNHEETPFDEYIYYGIGGPINGTIRTNDFLPVGSHEIWGQMITSRELIFEGDEIEFDNVIEHAPPYPFPERFDYIRDHATIHIPRRRWRNDNGSHMTWIKFRGDQGIDIYQYPAGTPRSDSLFEHTQVPQGMIIYVDGMVEVEGYVTGQVTIYSSGNMYLIDNIQYTGSRERDGWFESEGFPHMLGLVSDKNIIIKDNIPNGKQNGWDHGGINRHSININGSLIALGGSFTFEHQNDDWERYQGPDPDIRGYVHLNGSVAQFRRGYLYRNNHDGTGYGVNYSMDPRLLTIGPPGFGPGEYPDISGRHDRLLLIEGIYTFTNTIVNKLVVPAGVEIRLDGANALTVRDTLIINGTDEEPVTIRELNQNSRAALNVDWGNRAFVEIQHANFSENVEINFEFDTLKVKQSRFEGPVYFEGNIYIDSCQFFDRTYLTSWRSMHVNRSTFGFGMDISGDVRDGELLNNTIVGSRFDGIIVHRFSNLEIKNNIIAFNGVGINNRHFEHPDMAFNCVYGNSEDNWLGCERGQGSISLDPLMEDYQRSEYNLMEDSPCIDAGDPSFPLDPDESRVDIGAYYFDHEPWSIDETPIPENFQISTFPNPFNSSLRVSIINPQPENVEWSMVNINGQIISGGQWSLKQGENDFTLNSLNIDTPGVYFLKFGLNGITKHKKLIYLP